MKKVYCEIKVTEKDREQQLFTVKNKHLFTDLSDFEFCWKVEAEGIEIESGVCENVNAAPLSESDFTVPYSKDKFAAGKECVLTVSFRNKTEKRWCEQGFEQGFDQFVLQEAASLPACITRGRARHFDKRCKHRCGERRKLLGTHCGRADCVAPI